MKLLIRADASPEIGTGHVMRCLALAQAWQEAGGKAVFLMHAPVGGIEHRLRREGMTIIPQKFPPGTMEDAKTTATLARRFGCSWVVADGYHFDSTYQQQIKKDGLNLLIIDDYGHAQHYWADMVLNQNLHACEELYSARASYTRLLLGPKFILLRREFLSRPKAIREIRAIAQKILITLGGGDPQNITGKVIRALEALRPDGLEAVVLAGGAYPHLKDLETSLAQLPFPARLEVNTIHMPDWLAWADVGITGGGSTCWETAYLGLPCLIIIAADNQRPIAKALAERGAATVLGWHEDVSPGHICTQLSELLSSKEMRLGLSQRSQALVDGMGARRVRQMLWA